MTLWSPIISVVSLTCAYANQLAGKTMNRATYLADPDVQKFRDWFVGVLRGTHINFNVGHITHATLSNALAAYCWPLRTQTGLANPHPTLPFIHPVVPVLKAHSSLATNTTVLYAIQCALRTAYAGRTLPALAGAVASVFHWGGVYTAPRPGKGNRGWLEANHLNLWTILNGVVVDHATGTCFSSVPNLRFNSGMTKVYSLLIDNFIIYDSRVAAALAWLVHEWWVRVCKKTPPTLPDLLRFSCPPANGKASQYRYLNLTLFPEIANNPYVHYAWNIKANWLLEDALQLAGPAGKFGSMREIEAALFQLGERVI